LATDGAYAGAGGPAKTGGEGAYATGGGGAYTTGGATRNGEETANEGPTNTGKNPWFRKPR
jgi:hypothetical protein